LPEFSLSSLAGDEVVQSHQLHISAVALYLQSSGFPT